MSRGKEKRTSCEIAQCALCEYTNGARPIGKFVVCGLVGIQG